MSDVSRQRTRRVHATVIDTTGVPRRRSEQLVGEEPLEIRVALPDGEVVATTSTMRTPGQDFALAAGLLHAEGVIAERADIAAISYCAEAGEQQYNVVTVRLSRPPRRALAERTTVATASCGVCGTATIDELAARLPAGGLDLPARGGDPGGAGGNPGRGGAPIEAALLASLTDALAAAQPLFDRTGGLHAAGLFDRAGGLIGAAEDVGRHNALDKAIGEQLLAGRLAAADAARDVDPTAAGGHDPASAPAVAVLSGRVSFELVQKAAAARIPIICAVSAPSSLAVDTADRLGITLAGFVRDGRLTVYTHPGRVAAGARAAA